MIGNYLKVSLLVAFVVGMVSCNNSMENMDEEKMIENDNAIKKYIADSSITAVKDTTGIYYSITPNPTGARLAQGEEITVRYNAYLLDGTKIWTSEKDTSKYLSYPFGSNFQFVVFGMERALFLMRVGEKAKVFIPFQLGFSGYYTNILTGYKTSATIPEYSAIRVDIELVKKRTELQQINEFIEAKNLTIKERTSDNLIIANVTTVAGDTIGLNKAVKIQYKGQLLNGTVFDAGATPLEFTTGSGRTIPGFDRAIQKLKVGQEATIVLPSALAYGKTGVVNAAKDNFTIRPYQPITFTVKVLQ